MQQTFFDILSFEHKLRENFVIVSLSDSTKNQSLNTYNSSIEKDKLFELLDSLKLEKNELDYLENYYSNSQHLQSKILGICILSYQILRGIYD